MLVDRVNESTLADLLDGPDSRARHAVEQRFGLIDGRKRGDREVADELGSTPEAARRLVTRALHAMRRGVASRSTAAGT